MREKLAQHFSACSLFLSSGDFANKLIVSKRHYIFAGSNLCDLSIFSRICKKSSRKTFSRKKLLHAWKSHFNHYQNNLTTTSGGSWGRVGGSGTPYQIWGFFCFHYYPWGENNLQGQPKCTFQSLKSPNFNEGDPQTPPPMPSWTRLRRVKGGIANVVYFQKFSFNFTFSWKPWDPLSKIPGSAPDNRTRCHCNRLTTVWTINWWCTVFHFQ